MSIRRIALAGAFLLAAAGSVFAAPPEGMIQINYHRCDAKYTNWGVHLWQDPNMPLEDIEWSHAMAPTGTNEFGVYWQRKAEEFGPKIHVNYIIHRGDIKEQGGKDMSFNGQSTKEIWVVSGDRAIYTTLAEAQAADPCKKK